MKLDLGSTVDRYVVESVIGAGGTAMVYLVRHNHLKTPHALKVLTVTSDAIRQRMLKEGQVQAALRHLNVVAVTDVLDIGGAPGLLMEYVAGPSLERALGHFRIRMGDAEVLFNGIIAGVRQAHLLGLVHRDLKPANVLLAQSGEGFVPKVTDFGLVKTLSGDPSIASTRQGIAMGTPSYMAPEQIRDARTVDRRADVWSLGCILYELVTRRRAFPGDEALAIYNAVAVGDYPDPRRWVPDLPDRLHRAILGALTVDRDERIPDCETLLRVIRGHTTWEAPERPDPEHATDEEPRPLVADVPNMPVAARGPGGSTPGPSPVRQATPAPSALSAIDRETLVSPGGGVDGTLDASDSLVDSEREAQASWIMLALLAGAALMVASIPIMILAVYFTSTLVGDSVAPVTERPVVPATPAEQPVAPDEELPAVDTPPEVAPAPVPRAAPAPRPSPRVRPSPAPVVPGPEPSPAPVVPDPDPAGPATVKILSMPPTAIVHVDGQERGRTPLKIELAPGRYAVSLTSGSQRAEYVLTVGDGSNKWCYDFATAANRPGGC